MIKWFEEDEALAKQRN